MRLKTYVVNSVPEAMSMIKRDLGSEALILNTKKVKKGGFLGLFKKEKLEVIAAVETRKKSQYTHREHKDIPDIEKKVEENSDSVPVEKIPPKVEANLTSELINELKHIKKFMVQVIEEDRLPASLKPINKQLTNQEIIPEIRTELFAKLMLILGQDPDFTSNQVIALVRKEIIQLINDHQTVQENKVPTIICFVGPTGVGKTTTIAKIAADYMLKEDKKVGLITSDTYRIAAVEQLKTYAGILNIPIEVVQSTADLKVAMSELNSCEIILMDTAGRNYQQREYVDEIEQLFSDKHQVQINLVLSLTSKYEDMKKIIDNFKTIKIDQLLLTKKDETSSYGSILNLIYTYQIPLRYLTNGQNVPDDIVAVTPELIANFVLGEDEND